MESSKDISGDPPQTVSYSFFLGSEEVRATPRQKLDLTVSLGRISTDVLAALHPVLLSAGGFCSFVSFMGFVSFVGFVGFVSFVSFVVFEFCGFFGFCWFCDCLGFVCFVSFVCVVSFFFFLVL